MTRLTLILFLSLSVCATRVYAQEANYELYHHRIMEAEKLIASENYDQAMELYESVLAEDSYIFRRDCIIAIQIAIHLDQEDIAFEFLRKGVQAGWEIKKIKKNDYLKPLKVLPGWQKFEVDYPKLRQDYEASINEELRDRVKTMYSKDQKKAMGALLRFGSKSQDNYAENKFSPHSEEQMEELRQILAEYGYPGEKLIGNDYWASTILSHHNSISQNYAQKDTLYPSLKSDLSKALLKGEVSPFELALIDEWYRSTLAQGHYIGYGILNPPTESNLTQTNELRAKVFLRTVETRNALVDIQEKTQMNFYLPGEGWIDGKIEVTEN